MRSLLSILTLSLIPLLFMAPELSAQPEPIMIYAVEALGHADGTFSSRRLVYDRQTGLFSPVAEHDAPPVAGQAEALLPPNFMFKPLIVLQSSRWAGSAAKTFRVAEEAPTNSRLLMKNIARVRGVMNLVHRRKGSLRIPRFIFSNQNVPVQDIVDPVLEYQQFNLDGRNVVARTADNRFFRFDPPGITSRVLRFEFANSDDCTLDGGVFRCRFFVQECDIYVKARTMMDPGFFEDLTVLRQRQALAGLLKFCHGHNLNTWGHDLGGGLGAARSPIGRSRTTTPWSGTGSARKTSSSTEIPALPQSLQVPRCTPRRIRSSISDS